MHVNICQVNLPSILFLSPDACLPSSLSVLRTVNLVITWTAEGPAEQGSRGLAGGSLREASEAGGS
jgi:hypothetical protein